MTAVLATLASAGIVPRAFSIPDQNGFPNSDSDQQKAIGLQAGGLLPDGPLPQSLDAASTTVFQLVAFNELFETAYFSSLLQNITSKVAGYEKSDKAIEDTVRVVLAVRVPLMLSSLLHALTGVNL